MGDGKLSFEEFYDKNYLKVFRYLYKKISNRNDAEDLTQEIFTYCYEKYDCYDPDKSSLTTWLFLIVNGRLKNYYRDRKENIDLDSVVDFLKLSGNEMDDSVYIEEVRNMLAEALRCMPEIKRKTVIYKYFYNKSHSDIARLLNISENSSRVILNRSLKELKKALEKYID